MQKPRARRWRAADPDKSRRSSAAASDGSSRADRARISSQRHRSSRITVIIDASCAIVANRQNKKRSATDGIELARIGSLATYLVTGGCGFIGSHLADSLSARGHTVRILDDLSSGRTEYKPAAAELVVGDVADASLVERAIDGADGCFHLAAVASVERSNRDWLPSHRTNLTGAITVFDRARRSSPVPVVYASSAAVYGNNPVVPLNEAAATRPLSAYGADKLGCERSVARFSNQPLRHQTRRGTEARGHLGSNYVLRVRIRINHHASYGRDSNQCHHGRQCEEKPYIHGANRLLLRPKSVRPLWPEIPHRHRLRAANARLRML